MVISLMITTEIRGFEWWLILLVNIAVWQWGYKRSSGSDSVGVGVGGGYNDKNGGDDYDNCDGDGDDDDNDGNAAVTMVRCSSVRTYNYINLLSHNLRSLATAIFVR